MVAISPANSGWVFSSISGTRVNAPLLFLRIPPGLERKLGVRLCGQQHPPELRLDAVEPPLVVRLEAQHDHRRSVRGARESESVRILDTQAVETDHLGGAWKRRF